MTQTDPAVHLDGVVKTFTSKRSGEPVRALAGVDLRIERGEVVALLGPNGAGKTTALDVVLGLTRPTTGRARTCGLAPRDAVRAGRVSAVLQSGGLLHDLTVRETVEIVATTYPDPAATDDVLARAGLIGLARRKVSKCSGGEQQRLRFALTLLPDPELLILDEPTAGMDVTARRDFWDAMHAEAERGRTVVFATHYLQEADTFADRIVLLAGGRIVADGTTAEIRARATGRTLTATLPEDVDARREVLSIVRALPGVHQLTEQRDRMSVLAADSDALALAVLNDERLRACGVGGVEIAGGTLESAFVALTASTPDDRQEAAA